MPSGRHDSFALSSNAAKTEGKAMIGFPRIVAYFKNNDTYTFLYKQCLLWAQLERDVGCLRCWICVAKQVVLLSKVKTF